MNFQDELEKLIIDNAILGVDSGQAYFVDLDQAVTSIINLVDRELPKKMNRAFNPNSIDMEIEKARAMEQIGYNQAIDDMRAIIRSNK